MDKWPSLKQIFNLKWVLVGVGVFVMFWLGTAFAFNQRQVFLPGQTSVGHYLFDASCKSCHQGFQPVSNETCLRCHQAEMAADAHGQRKFSDFIRWAETFKELPVLTCTTCHQEHVPMFGRGVNLPPDLCMTCHQGIIQGDLQSHQGFAPDGCWTGGCHNYHDHRSISTGFLRSNLSQPPVLPQPGVPVREVRVDRKTPTIPDLVNPFLGEG